MSEEYRRRLSRSGNRVGVGDATYQGFVSAWGGLFFTAELRSPSELLETHTPTTTILATTMTTMTLHVDQLKLLRNTRRRL
jgi:hypothetical protein